ncbi:hypothetical protein [Daejeonella lutea]|uniref:Uncharacterized protein n=1 Tax=Daejeonella lutea TaxID=572036 RepID=A0A1T5EI10_9SPHI|nr:hypothetical protein [Daejeonella lutea]SKB83703.1 hypothetical protein SAMN05661099_3039 [Daejeonella lutea]
MRIWAGIFLLFMPFVLLAQEVVSIKEGKAYNQDELAPFLHKLTKSNDFVISYRMQFTDKPTEKSDYFILAKNDSNLAAFSYIEKNQQLKPINLANKNLLLVWDTFVQNELFSIKNEKDIPNFCLEKYQIYNSHSYEFVLIGKRVMKRLLYYDPEYYDNVCYGMAERRKIINSVSVINYVVNN